MMQTAENWTRHHTQRRRQLVSMHMQWSWKGHRRLGNPWSQGHMRPTSVIMSDPFIQQTPQVILFQGYDEV